MTKEELDEKVEEQKSIIEHTENQICSYVMQYIETLPYKVGDKVNVYVVDINVEREKVAFSVKDFKKAQARKEINQYISSEDNVGGAYTLGDMLNDQKNN